MQGVAEISSRVGRWIRKWRRALGGIVAVAAVTIAIAWFTRDGGGSGRDESPTYGWIFVDTPEVYTRERLVNDRFRQGEWLKAQLDASDELEFGPQALIDSGRSAAVRAEMAIATSAAGSDGRVDAGGVKLPATTPKMAEAPEAEGVGPTQSPIDEFRDRLAYRGEVRSEMIQNELDDRHDICGNTVYRLKFDSTVVPGDRTSAHAVIVVRLSSPFETQGHRELTDLEGMYHEWLSATEAGLNGVLQGRLAQVRRVLKEGSVDFLTASEKRALYQFEEYLGRQRGGAGQKGGTNDGRAAPPEDDGGSGGVAASVDDLLWWLATRDLPKAERVRIARRAGKREDLVQRQLRAWYARWFLDVLDGRSLKERYGTYAVLDASTDGRITLRPLQKPSKSREFFVTRKDVTACVGARRVLLDALPPPTSPDGGALDAGDGGVEGDAGISQACTPARPERFAICNEGVRRKYDAYTKCNCEEALVGLEHGSVQTSGLKVKVDCFEKSGLENFVKELNDSSNRAYTYAVLPKQAAQRVSSELRGFDQRVLGLAAAAPVGSAQVNGFVNALDERARRANALERRPLVVGFSLDGLVPDRAARLGWLVGPRIRLTGSRSGEPEFHQQPVHNALSAIVSVPSWWRAIRVSMRALWLGRDGKCYPAHGREDGDQHSVREIPCGVALGLPGDGSRDKAAPTIGDGGSNGATAGTLGGEDGTSGLVPTEFHVSLPGDARSLEEILYQDPALREPSVDERALEKTQLQACEPADVLIPGQNLWRSTVVTLGSQVANRITVLPNMNGIVAHFDRVRVAMGSDSDRSGGKPVTLRVWTSYGAKAIVDKIEVFPPENGSRSCD